MRLVKPVTIGKMSTRIRLVVEVEFEPTETVATLTEINIHHNYNTSTFFF